MKRSAFITWEQIKVAALIAAALGILGMAVYRLGQAANLFTRRYELILFLPDAPGVREGGSVLLAGQLVGTISSIDFLPVDDDTVRNLRVVVGVNERVREQIRGDSRARVRTLGLLGDRVIDISPGTPRHAVLQPRDTIPVQITLDYETVLMRAAESIDDVVALAHDLRVITGRLAEGEGALGQLLSNRALYDQMVGTIGRMDQLLLRLQRPDGTFGRMLDDPALYNRLVATLASADSLLVALNAPDGTLGRLARDDSLYVHLVSMVQSADSLVSMVARGEGMAGRLLTDQALYDQLNKLVHDLSATLEDVRREPRRYLRGLIRVF